MRHYRRIFPALYICSFGAIGALFPLIAQHLSKIGFSGGQIGLITSASTAIGIISNSFWGKIYHSRQNDKLIIMFLCVLTAIISLFFMIIKSFWIFLCLYILVFFFENPIFPLLDSTVMEVDYPFGIARKWGAVGFAFGIGVAGVVVDHFGLIWIFPMFAVFFLLTGLLLLSFLRIQNKLSIIDYQKVTCGKDQAHKGSKSKSDYKGKEGSYRDLLLNKKYMALLLSAFFFNGPALAHNTYFSFLYIDAGGTIAGMGIVLLLMVLSEAPVMAVADRISSLLTMEKAIVLAMTISALRFLWYSTNPAPVLIAATFILQGLANGIVLVEIVKYTGKLVGTSMLSLAIPLLTALSSNCGTIVCQFLGGIIVESFGGTGVYLFYGIFNLIGILTYLFSGLHRTFTSK